MSNNSLEKTAKEFIRAYNEKDFARMREMIAPNFYFQHHNRGLEFSDPEEFVATLKQFATEALPDRGFGAAERVTCTKTTVVIQHSWGGTPKVDIPGMGNAGEKINLDLCSVMVFEGTLMTEYHDYG